MVWTWILCPVLLTVWGYNERTEALVLFLNVHLKLNGVGIVPRLLNLGFWYGVLLVKHFAHIVLCYISLCGAVHVVSLFWAKIEMHLGAN